MFNVKIADVIEYLSSKNRQFSFLSNIRTLIWFVSIGLLKFPEVFFPCVRNKFIYRSMSVYQFERGILTYTRLLEEK